jgi:2-polyprenyl-3-methyl-5-hydroxy-6-metoxy-1,4-benzoquinol methylase
MFKVGKVEIDDSCYPGTDIYSEGAIEDEMLEVAKTIPSSQYNEIIREKEKWSILYHFSNLRGNIISWLPMLPTESVLEIGAGCGAITGTLLEKAKKVTTIDLSMKRSLINAHRHQEAGHLKIMVGNFEDVEKNLVEKYELITLIGVFEYAAGYINTVNPYVDFLKTIRKHLTEKGRIVIAIENRFGLKYWAGCKEDHTGRYFEGIGGYKNTTDVRTFSKVELCSIFEKAGFNKWEFHYPYPDYKFPTKIFSDDYLPNAGELSDNSLNFDEERLVLFDESSVFDSIIADSMFPYFSNSFLIVLEAE